MVRRGLREKVPWFLCWWLQGAGRWLQGGRHVTSRDRSRARIASHDLPCFYRICAARFTNADIRSGGRDVVPQQQHRGCTHPASSINGFSYTVDNHRGPVRPQFIFSYNLNSAIFSLAIHFITQSNYVKKTQNHYFVLKLYFWTPGGEKVSAPLIYPLTSK